MVSPRRRVRDVSLLESTTCVIDMFLGRAEIFRCGVHRSVSSFGRGRAGAWGWAILGTFEPRYGWEYMGDTPH